MRSAAFSWSELRARYLPATQGSVLPPRIKLPVLPTVVLQFTKLAESPMAAPKELGALIERDSTLTCELLKYVNSSQFGGRSKVSTAQRAISRIGIRTAKNFLLSTGVRQTMKASKSKLINIQNLWLTNLERAILAREIATKLRADSDLAFSASILQDFLLPVLSNELLETYAKYLEINDDRRPTLVQHERTCLGWDHALATAQVLGAWGFADDLVCCVRLHHMGLRALEDPVLGKTALAAVAVAALIPDPIRQTPHGLEQLVSLDGIWPKFQLTEMAQLASSELHELTPLAVQHTTLARRLEKHLTAAT